MSRDFLVFRVNDESTIFLLKTEFNLFGIHIRVLIRISFQWNSCCAVDPSKAQSQSFAIYLELGY